MSKVVKGEERPVLDIGSLDVKEIVHQRPSTPSKNDATQEVTISAVNNRSSVCAWNLPIMEKEDDLHHKKEDLKTKLARLEKEAYEKGFEQGQKDGLALEQKKIEEMGKQLEALLSEINNLKVQIYSESEGELLKLCMAITRKIISTEVTMNKAIIGNTIQSALKFVADKRKIRIILNPDDLEDVKRLLPDLSKLIKGGQFQLTEDHTIEKGGCMIETGFGKINATIDEQMALLEDEIERFFLESRGPACETLT